MTSAVELEVNGRVVARLHDGSDMAPGLSPRPFVEAWTLEGEPVTEIHPTDHPHHYGLSAAVPDVDGVSYWGGRTYVRESGSTMLANHGTQRIESRTVSVAGVIDEISWRRPDGTLQIAEQREVSVEAFDGGWTLDWVSRLRAPEGATFGSPATNGRPGAFYGGLFWRTPFRSAAISSEGRTGVAAAHGSESPWLAIQSSEAALVAAAPRGYPWFVRDDDYVGFGPAVAVEHRRAVQPGGRIDAAAPCRRARRQRGARPSSGAAGPCSAEKEDPDEDPDVVDPHCRGGRCPWARTFARRHCHRRPPGGSHRPCGRRGSRARPVRALARRDGLSPRARVAPAGGGTRRGDHQHAHPHPLRPGAAGRAGGGGRAPREAADRDPGRVRGAVRGVRESRRAGAGRLPEPRIRCPRLRRRPRAPRARSARSPGTAPRRAGCGPRATGGAPRGRADGGWATASWQTACSPILWRTPRPRRSRSRTACGRTMSSA